MVNKDIVIEGARIGFRNFSGKAGKFNAEGKRNFCVFLPEDVAKELLAEGWKVKWLKPRDEDDAEQAYLSVEVRYDNIPPRILLISSAGKTLMDNETVGLLDWAEIKDVDLIIRPYNWTMSGNRSGVKAYVKSMYVTLVEDEFEKKYINVPDTAADSIGGCGHCEACDGNCSHGDKLI